MAQHRQQRTRRVLTAKVDGSRHVAPLLDLVQQAGDPGIGRSRLEKAQGRNGLRRHAGQARRRLGTRQVDPVNAIVLGQRRKVKSRRKMGNQPLGEFDFQRQQAVQRSRLKSDDLDEFLLRAGQPRSILAQTDRPARHPALFGQTHGRAETLPKRAARRPVMKLLPLADAAERGNQARTQGRQKLLELLAGPRFLAECRQAALVAGGQQGPETVIDRPQSLFLHPGEACGMKIIPGQTPERRLRRVIEAAHRLVQTILRKIRGSAQGF